MAEAAAASTCWRADRKAATINADRLSVSSGSQAAGAMVTRGGLELPGSQVVAGGEHLFLHLLGLGQQRIHVESFGHGVLPSRSMIKGPTDKRVSPHADRAPEAG